MANTQSGLQILSLNVYHGHLIEELVAYIGERSKNVSVMCFQETSDTVRPKLDQLLMADFSAHHVSKPGYGETHYVSMYIRRDMDVIDVTRVYLDVAYAGFGLRCKLADGLGQEVAITGVHGNPRPGHKLDTDLRLGFSKHLINTALQDSADTEVIVGDFNLLPHTESVKMFTNHGFRNLIHEYEIPSTRNELAWRKYPEHMRQYFADYAFVRGGGASYDFMVDDVVVSDHLPMIVGINSRAILAPDSREALALH